MSISFCVLASGSSGNCTLVSLHDPDGDEGSTRHLLIDAGLSPRETARRLGPLGLTLEAIGDVLVTHADTDHLHAGWAALRRRPMWNVTWRAHRRHLGRNCLGELPMTRIEPFEDSFELSDDTRVDTTLLPHDNLGTIGFVIDHAGARLGYATDLGRVPRSWARQFADLGALAVESNYDRALQVTSERPDMLKRRIMGGLGHLSNEQALDAVLAADHGRLEHVVLLHLSRQCNDPGLVRRLYVERAPHLLGRLTFANQRVPTPILHVRAETVGAALTCGAGRQLNFLEEMTGPS